MAIDNNKIDLNKLDKENVYCYSCYKNENKLIKLDFNNKTLSYNICNKHKGRNFKTLRWCKDIGSWHCFYGVIKEARCQSCILSKRNKSKEMIKISKQNGYLYGSQNMINNHKKFDFEITCEECNDKECKSKQKFIENNEYQTKLHKFLNNSCIDKMLTDEIRSKNAAENAKRNWKNPEYAKKIAQNLGDYLGNPDWTRKVGAKGREALAEIFKNDTNFGKKIISNALKYLDKHPEIRQECGRKNIQKAKEVQLKSIHEEILKLDLIITENSVNVSNIQELKKNDICGSYVIKGKFKEYKGTNKENNVYNLLVCKSVKVYNEIYWILRVLSNPEKQDKNDFNWTIAKWWYIANLYYNFEFILLTDENGISEEEAILTEAKYGFGNNMICDREQIKIDGYSKTHSYWNL